MFKLSNGLLGAGCLAVSFFAPPQAEAQAGGGISSNQFNPAISLILDGKYAKLDNDAEAYELPGFQLGGEAGVGAAGFSAEHTELVFSANVDDMFYAGVTSAIASHEGTTELELEEAFVESIGLGEGLSIKAGRFFSGLGYLNSQHSHSWDFADVPLIYRGLFGNQLNDEGVQVRWIAPTDLYLQLGAELLSGRSFPAGGAEDGDAAHTLFIKLGGDVGVSHSWQLGLSRWQADVAARSSGGHAHGGAAAEEFVFAGDSAINGLDFVWKWAPDGNPRQRNLKFQFEYFQRDEDGDVTNSANAVETTTYDGTQSGWYGQLVYQFQPQWRVGLRHDRLMADNSGSDAVVLGEAGLDDEGHTPKRSSLMVDYNHSEFSRLRLQYNQDDSSENPDHQITLQYTMSMGAHGAHQF
jgi:hypothetical protein